MRVATTRTLSAVACTIDLFHIIEGNSPISRHFLFETRHVSTQLHWGHDCISTLHTRVMSFHNITFETRICDKKYFKTLPQHPSSKLNLSVHSCQLKHFNYSVTICREQILPSKLLYM